MDLNKHPIEENLPIKKWYKNKYIILIFSILIISTVGYFLLKNFKTPNLNKTAEQPPITQNEDTDTASVKNILNYTQELLGAADIYNDPKTPETKKQEVLNQMVATAQVRKEELLKRIENDPDSVLELALKNDGVKKLPNEVLQFIEKPVQVTGEFDYIIGDNFKQGISKNSFYIETKDNNYYQIHSSKEPQFLSDDIVNIEGIQIDEEVATNESMMHSKVSNLSKSGGGQSDTSEDLTYFSVSEAQPTQRTMAIVMLNFKDDASNEPVNKEWVREKMFGANGSVSQFISEASFGQTKIVPKKSSDGSKDIYGYVTIPQKRPFTSGNCDSYYYKWSGSALESLNKRGVDLSEYDMVSFIMTIDCDSWSGRGSLGGKKTMLWLPIDNEEYQKSIVSTWAHEVGHNLGLDHSNSIECKKDGKFVSIAKKSQCKIIEYGDPFSVMGASSFTFHYTAYQKGGTGPKYQALNWIGPKNKVTVDLKKYPDEKYTVVPIETKSSGTQSLRIPRSINGGPTNEYYYIEFRQPLSAYFEKRDGYLNIFDGILIRIGPDYNTQGKTKLINANPNESFADAALTVGKTFIDTEYGINIKLESISSSNAVVRVYSGKPEPEGNLPIVDINNIETYTDSAKITAEITSNGGQEVTKTGFRYGLVKEKYTDTINTKLPIYGKKFTGEIKKLKCDTRYYYQALATNIVGTNHSEELIFNTKKCSVPEVNTSYKLLSEGKNSARVGGNIISDGGKGIKMKGFWYHEKEEKIKEAIDGKDLNTYAEGLDGIQGENIGEYTIDLNNLRCGQAYYYRAFAENSIGLGFGEINYFKTLACDGTGSSAPMVETLSTENITTKSATLYGKLINNGGGKLMYIGFRYGKGTNLADRVYLEDKNITDYSFKVDDLDCDENYAYEAFASSTTELGLRSGKGLTKYFRTKPCPKISKNRPIVPNLAPEQPESNNQDQQNTNNKLVDHGIGGGTPTDNKGESGDDQSNKGLGGGTEEPAPKSGLQITLTNPLKSNTLEDFVQIVLSVLLKFLIPILAILFMYTGFKLVTAKGDTKALTAAKQDFFNLVIGAVLILGAWTFGNIIMNTLKEVGILN